MIQLYGHKWHSAQGDKLTEKNDFSTNFILWCKKTAHLSEKQWRNGFEKLEFEVQEAGRRGKQVWPPSYAEFIGMCEIDPGASAHKLFVPRLPEPKEVKSERKEKGRQRMDSIKSLFDEC